MRVLAILAAAIWAMTGIGATATEMKSDPPDFQAMTERELTEYLIDNLVDEDGVLNYLHMNQLYWAENNYNNPDGYRDGFLVELIKKRFSCVRGNAIGAASTGHKLNDDFNLVLGGPPDRFRHWDDRYIIGNACQFRSCSHKGLMIVDRKERAVHFGIIHSVPWYVSIYEIEQDRTIYTYEKQKYNKKEYTSLFVSPDKAHKLSEDVYNIFNHWLDDVWGKYRYIPREQVIINTYALNCARS